ncbi:MAG: acyltransferase family protein [Promethearchaeota archaeon]
MLMETVQQEISKDSTHFLQIDLLKGLMIMLVIVDHAIPWDVRATWGHSLWERISIPVFLIIMGFNMAQSFRRKGVPLDSFKSYLKYYWHKFKRYYIPFGILFVVSTVVGLIYYGSFDQMLTIQFEPHYHPDMVWYFILPFYGPGNWFIPVLFGAVLVIPLLYWCYQKYPKYTLVGSLLWEIGIQYFTFSYFGHYVDWWPNVPIGRTKLQLSILFYFNALVLGFWIADHPHLMVSQRDESAPGEPPQTISQSRPAVSWHFYLVIVTLITLGITVIDPLLAPIIGEWQSVVMIMMAVMVCLGLYFYRPLSEFVMVFILSLGIWIGWLLLGDLYHDRVWMDWNTRTYNAEVGLFFLAMLVFSIPYILLLVFKWLKFKPKNANFFLWTLALLSTAYLAVTLYDGFRFYLITGDYHYMTYPHSALIVLTFLSVVPRQSKNKLLKGFAVVGKATFHILLTQIFIYGIIMAMTGEHYMTPDSVMRLVWFSRIENYTAAVWMYTISMWIICIPIGISWYYAEKWVRKYFADRREKFQSLAR